MSYVNPHYLVDADWLQEHLNDPNLRLLEVTADHDAEWANVAKSTCYDKRHIPGAVFLDVASFRGPFSDPDGEFPLTWTTLRQFETIMGEIGVANDSFVVIYASSVPQRLYSCSMWCTRAWRIMHHFGVRCAILNGNLEKWIAEGRPVTNVPGSYLPTIFRADPDWSRGIAYKDDVIASLKDSACAVANALPLEMHLGQSPIFYGPRKGHITGSVSAPMPALVDWDTGVFISEESMRIQLEQAGLLSADRVITYCGGGGCATTLGFSLALLGVERVAMYDNSLHEWAADPSLPMTDPSGEGAKA